MFKSRSFECFELVFEIIDELPTSGGTGTAEGEVHFSSFSSVFYNWTNLGTI